MNRDPIVEEIHRIREKMWDDCGGTMEGLLRSLHATEAQHPDRVITLQQFRDLRDKSTTPKP